MLDHCQSSALILTALLLPAFGYLYLRFRSPRTLLWFLGFVFALASMALLYGVGAQGAYCASHPWRQAAGESALLIGTALFLASLSPLRFRLGRFQVLYVIPFTAPLVLYSILLYGVFHGASPRGALFFLFPALAGIALCVGFFWGFAKGSVPVGVGVPVVAALGGVTFWAYYAFGAADALLLVQSANLFMTAVLLIYVFRRFSPGVVLSVFGFLVWCLPALRIFFIPVSHSAWHLLLFQDVSLSKVVAAMGMILLALEDQLNLNRAAQKREYHARRELEAYTQLILSRRRVEDFDRQGPEICATVVEYSRFSQAALLLTSGGRFSLAGSAGMDAALARTVGELAARLPAAEFLAPGSAPPAVENSQTVRLDLSPWLLPGDDLKRLHFTQVLAVPMTGRSGVEGALLLAGLRAAEDSTDAASLRAEDLLPIEMLTARLQATRSQTMMLEQLIDAEKYSGLGQLAANVTQQLNNPLTVILGYASLLEEAKSLDAQERKGVESILTEARRMRSTLESLTRLARPRGDLRTAVSLAELLADIEQLYRSEFLQRSIEFQLNIAAALPRVLCSAQQLRQALLHCLQFALAAVEQQEPQGGPPPARIIRLEATSEGSQVQILVAHSGPGFPNPERAFDPFAPAQPGSESAILGLSLCASILRDNNGRASAVNLEPRGAAIILELQSA